MKLIMEYHHIDFLGITFYCIINFFIHVHVAITRFTCMYPYDKDTTTDKGHLQCIHTVVECIGSVEKFTLSSSHTLIYLAITAYTLAYSSVCVSSYKSGSGGKNKLETNSVGLKQLYAYYTRLLYMYNVLF